MIFKMTKPGPLLAKFIDHFWFYEGYQPEHSMERLLPDGTMEIVIDLRDSPKKLHRRENYDCHQAFRRSWISGKHTRYIVIEAVPNSSMMGVHFKPGGTSPFLKFPAVELTDQVVELNLIGGSEINSLREQLIETSEVYQKFQILERFLIYKAGGVLKYNPMLSVCCCDRRMVWPSEVWLSRSASAKDI